MLSRTQVEQLGYKSIGLPTLSAAAGPSIPYGELAEAVNSSYGESLASALPET